MSSSITSIHIYIYNKDIYKMLSTSTVWRVSFEGENFREFRVSVAIRENFLRKNLFSSN